MNKSNTRRNIGKFLILTFILGSSIAINSIQPKSEIAAAWSGTQTSNEGSYYSSVGSETGTALKNKLKSIISNPDPDTNYDWSRFEAADEAEGDSSKVLLIYSRKTIAKSEHVDGNYGWNREHTFPDSKIGSTAKKDNHHIFADDNKTNNSRGNKLFGVVAQTSGNVVKDMDEANTDNYTAGNYFMPNPLARGEVARGTMYLTTLYGYEVTANFQTVALMLEWHLSNPVTNREIYRNNKVQTMQNNRNPFIDHPEYACKIWGDTNNDTKAVCGTQQATPSITLNKTTAEVNVSSTTTLSATVNNSSSTVSWSSNATSIATVNSSGVVTGVAAGTATITAKITDNSVEYTANCVVTVKNPSGGNVAVTGIVLNKTTASILVNGTTSLTATVSPSNATTNTIKWTTSNSTVASISSTTNKTITVTGLAVGTATITATTDDGGKQASCVVTVTSGSSSGNTTVQVTRSDFSGATTGYVEGTWTKGGISGKGNIYFDTTAHIQINSGNTPMPYNSTSTPGPITNISVTMPGSGSLRDLTPRVSATAAITTGSGGTALTKQTFTSNTQTLSWNISKTEDIRYFYLMPSGNTNWSNFSFTYDVGGYTPEPVLTSISIGTNPAKTSYLTGEQLDLSGLVVNANYSNAPTEPVTGYTTNPVSGAILNTVGTQEVTVSYQGKSTSFDVTVSPINVTLVGVSLNTTDATLDINGTLSLNTTINPTNAYPAPSISWQSSNSTVASVSTSGLVTALKSGSATITVTAIQNSITKTATCSVTVNAAVFVPTTTYTEGGGISTTASLTTNVSSLAIGDKILIAASAENYVMSTTQNVNSQGQGNRSSVAVTKTGDKSKITDVDVLTMQVITLEAGTIANTFAFNVGDGYLYASGISENKNSLKTQSSIDANASFAITISNGAATVTSQGGNIRNVLQFNTTNNPKLFSCYTSGQTAIAIYEMDAGSVTKYNYNYLIDALKGTYCIANLTDLNLIYTRYEAMTSIEKNHFSTVIIVGNDGNNYTGEHAYNIAMIRRAAISAEGNRNIFTDTLKQNEVVMLVAIISLIGVTAIAGTLFIFKLKRKKSD